MSAPRTEDGGAGLVLAGGGARAPYAAGALAALLPRLHDEIKVIVGTSVGALTSAYLAANWHRPAEEIIEDGLEFWRQLRFGDVLAPLVSPGGVGRFLRYVSEFLPVRTLHSPALLHPEPLERTLERLVHFDQLTENLRSGRLRALGVVATPAYSNSSVVFHEGGTPRHDVDPLRAIRYTATTLDPEHILASSAIPALFPAVHISTPAPAAGWYFDGAPRLNTPIKPALWLGAERVIVIALNSVTAVQPPSHESQPDFYVGAAHLLHAALGDPLAQDIRTLANTNALIAAGQDAEHGHAHHRLRLRGTRHGPQDGAGPVRPVPYIVIAPEDPAGIGEIAQRIYTKHYRRPWNAGFARELWLLGQILNGGADAMHGELLSYLFFANEFAEELIELGRADAQRWIDEHPGDLWQLDPLPQWSRPDQSDERARGTSAKGRRRRPAA